MYGQEVGETEQMEVKKQTEQEPPTEDQNQGEQQGSPANEAEMENASESSESSDSSDSTSSSSSSYHGPMPLAMRPPHMRSQPEQQVQNMEVESNEATQEVMDEAISDEHEEQADEGRQRLKVYKKDNPIVPDETDRDDLNRRFKGDEQKRKNYMIMSKRGIIPDRGFKVSQLEHTSIKVLKDTHNWNEQLDQ